MVFEFHGTPPAWLAALVFGGVGAAGIAIGIGVWRQAVAIRRRGVLAEATVIGKRTSSKRSCGESCGRLRFVKVRWEDAAGHKRVAEGIVNRIYESTSEGDRIPIFYLPQAPGDATKPAFAFVDEPSQVRGAIGCLFFSLLFLGVGIWAIVASWMGVYE